MLHTNHSFLAGGGEMGALMRAYDWRHSPLGSPDGWPSTLKTVLRVLLSSNHPMFIWWGDDLIQFYNDGYRQTLGPERHPVALGQPGRPCWEEAWDLIGPDIERVMREGASAWYEDRLVPLTRNGRREDVWWTYGYSPIEDGAGIRGVLVICNDVTEDHLLRQRLQQTNHALIETMDDGFCLVELIDDADGRAVDYRFIEANRAFARHTGLVDSVGQTARQLVPNLEQGWVDTYDGIARSGVARRFEEGSEAMGRWFNVYASPIDHPDKRRVALLFTDITDKKNAERALQASETAARAAASQAEADRRRFDALLSSAPVGIVYVDEHGALSAVNRMNRQLWGEHPMSTSQDQYAEWRGWWADGSERHGRQIRPEEWALARALRGEQVEADVVEIQPFGRPHERRTLLTRATAIRAEDGAITGAVAASMDLTDQVDTQRALRESEEKFRTITDAMPQMVWSSRADGQNDYTNRRWSDFTGLSNGDPAGWTAAIHPDDLQALLALWTDSLASGALFEIEHRLRHHGGEYRWVLNRALPVRDEAGAIIRWMGTVTDMHDQKLAAEELKAANARKDEFLAMLAHELRNPLAPISTAAQMLKLSGADPKRIAHASDVIGRQVRHMVELVDDLLDVSRVTRGLVELECEPVDLKSVIHNAIEQARPLIEKKGHTLSTRLGAANVTVTGDRKRLVQVIANLINNAAKYTPDGGEITVCADPLPESGQVKLSVKDTGIGIDAALLPDVFELFTQAKRTPDRAQGGLGLGLALVRSMVNLYGGTVEAHSDGPGRGSCFSVVLPLGVNSTDNDARQREADATLAAHSTLRIMIVDDNRDAAESLGIVLSAVGHAVQVEDSSMAAIARAQAESFDVCLLDIGLPDLDGYQLVRRLGKLPSMRGTVMIALSGYGQPQDIAASRRAGFATHLVKPVDIAHLLAVLDRLVEEARQ
ncbi:PAS domain S-box protein [Massilia sp. CFBP9026]|uniref:hybrid sensor histidine kinase/response regulator n=1 Tax=Massilia sp. CFBP9026 TaxID=3096536 RepID=UPI002A6ACF16|nr:PAS domain S-box protein [Massilia sp. CFBP9026]MDY0963635.1 PAS domain S-box protein [Massilia sp. CFBP9026]